MTNAADTFRDWMTRALDLAPTAIPKPRRAEYAALIEVAAGLFSDPEPWRQLPAAIRHVFGDRGWAWNGIYARHTEDQLLLVAAAGPPVCATLDAPAGAGVGDAGMCWDALLMNQTVVAANVKAWPGYVSCDGESGLATVAGLVCPIRDEDGRPVAVWDLDSTAPLAPEDPPFMDRFWASFSALLPAEKKKLRTP